jgi:carboxypeptidase family protein
MRRSHAAVGMIALGMAAVLPVWTAVSEAQSRGQVLGEVKLIGPAPPPRVVEVNKDTAVCGKEKKIVDVSVGAGNALAGAVVSMPDATGTQLPSKATLDQKGCEFHPEVLIMAPGELDIRNSDGILHNIHSYSSVNAPFNMAQPKFRKVISEEIGKPEIIRVQCDVHSWMHGWLFVTNHPATVTDTAGAFRLENVSPGQHKIEVWHPVLGSQSKTVDVKAGETVRVTFELAAKKS